MPIQGGDIVWTVSAVTSAFEKSMGQVSDRADAIKDKFKNTLDAAKTLGVGMTAVGAGIVASMGLAVKSFVDLGSELTDMSARTGVSVESLSGLKFAAEQSGTSIESLEGAIKRMQVAIAGGIDPDTGQMLDKTREKFDAIGVSVDTLRGKKPDEQFKMIARAIGSIQDPAEKSAAAVSIFGKSGTELLPLFGENIDALMAKAKELGLVMDTEAAAKAEKFGDTLDQLKGAFQGLLITAGPIIVDMLVPFVDRKSTRLNSSHVSESRMPSSA